MSKLSKELIENVKVNPTKTTYQENIEQLCAQIYKEEIVLPYYQTGIRWTSKKMVALLNFQLNGYAPVAPISVNQITNKDSNVAQVTFIERKCIIDNEDVQNRMSVNDGQQRLSTNFFAYINHPKVENIVLDLFKGKFVILKSIMEIKNHQVPVGILMNKDIQVLNDYKNNNSFLKRDEVSDLIKDVRSKLFSYYYTINLAKNLTGEEQLDWFWVLNNAGSTISALQMMFSCHFMKGLDIQVDYLNIFIEKVNQAGMNRFTKKETEVSIPVAALNPCLEIIMQKESHTLKYSPIASDARGKELCNLTTDKLKECFEITLAALDKTIEFIKINGLPYPIRMEYVTFLVGLYAYNRNTEFSEFQKDRIINWYVSINFVNMSNTDRRKNFDELLKILYLA